MDIDTPVAADGAPVVNALRWLAGQAVTDAAAQVGLAGEDGQRAVAATIRSRFQRMGVAYEPPP